MNGRDRPAVERRVLLVAPTAKDAALTRAVLGHAGIDTVDCRDLVRLCGQLEHGAGTLLLAEEAMTDDASERLLLWLHRQPSWSDLPVLLLARPGANSDAVTAAMEQLGNLTVLERPTRVSALVSAVHSALRARQRQYEIRGQLADLERLAAIVASSNDAILSKTLDGRILTWNAAAERMFGYRADEMIGQPIELLIPPDLRTDEAAMLQRLRCGSRLEHFETVRIAKDGRRLDLSVTVSPVHDGDGHIVGASSVARDISQSKRAAEALREADRRKDEFLAMLAHELRNPLAPIRSSLEILRLRRRDDPAVEQVASMMERQVSHMVRLVDDLLEVSRITRGKIELRKEPLDLVEVVRGAEETSRLLIESAGHHLLLDLPERPLPVEGDRVRLLQVLANLLNNAAKYMDPGGCIWLSVRGEGDGAVLSVRDAGTGIPPEMLPRVFDLFTQVDRNAARAQGGLGIGLTLVRSLVEMHGGSVVARSDGIGCGSEFVVRLPLAPAKPVAGPAAEDAPPASVPGLRVLVVDDNRDAADSLAMLLSLLGAEVQVAYDGAEALAVMPGFAPAVAILDIGLPGMDGHELARRIRQQPQNDGITLIALTGWGQDEDRRRSRAAGFDYHLIKPADVESLQSLLAALADPAAVRPLH